MRPRPKYITWSESNIDSQKLCNPTNIKNNPGDANNQAIGFFLIAIISNLSLLTIYTFWLSILS